ncbi:conjugal transfer protein TraI, partial [Roseomonas mucosa]|nr:conjugal transfer protein TraI [Roseomonas mucosa]
MSERRPATSRDVLLAATALVALALSPACAPAARAEGSVRFLSSPPMPGEAQYDAAAQVLASQL